MLVSCTRAVARASYSAPSLFPFSAPAPNLPFSKGGRTAPHSFLVRSLPLHSSGILSLGRSGIDSDTMAEVEGKGASDQATVSESTSQNKELGKLAVNIIPHILNLYSLKATAADYEIYASNATFEDPLMRASGVKQIKSAFYSMPKVFSEGKMAEYWVQEEETSPGAGKISIDNTQHYKIFGKTIDMKSLIKLQIENGKVTRHEDLWDKNPLWSRNTVRVPLVGRAVEGLRKVNMMVTHVLMGCGKDPKPKT